MYFYSSNTKATANITEIVESGPATVKHSQKLTMEFGYVTINDTQGIIQSEKRSIFSADYVPEMYRHSLNTSHDTVHICVVAAKPSVADEVKMLVKSVLLHSRRLNVFFHFILYEGSEHTVPQIFTDIKCTFTHVFYEFVYVDLHKYVQQKLRYSVNIRHASGIYAFGKIFMFDVFDNVDTCLVVDTDIVFAVDPAFLWSEIDLHLAPGVAVSAAEWKGPEFNSGLMLQNLTLMRQMKFDQLVSLEKWCRKSTTRNEEIFQCVHDQHILNQIYMKNQNLFNFVSVSWNIGNCKKFYNFNFTAFENKDLFFGAAHFTCLSGTVMNAFTNKTRLSENYPRLREYIYFLKDLKFQNNLHKSCSRPKDIRGHITKIQTGDN